MAELAETETQLAADEEELAKAERRLALTTLTAPVAGTVQQLAVHTEGGVVTEAQPLMLVVPDDAPVEVEARVSNKDIGFVHEGQVAMVKVETFDFTKYGLNEGEVTKVSRDAVLDEEQGLYYLAHIALAKIALDVDGRRVSIEPGMAVTAEVKMGQRRVLEFLLSPLLRYRQESGRER
jgi:hemolysin D